MAFEMLVRYRRIDKDTLMVQRRMLNVLTMWFYYPCEFLIWVFLDRESSIPEWAWQDWTLLNNIIFQIDDDMNYHAKMLLQGYHERKSHMAWIKGEVKTLEADKLVTYGFSKPFPLNPDKVKPIGLNFIKPKEEWKKVVNPKLFGTGRKRESGEDPEENHSGDGDQSSYTLSDFAPYHVQMEDAAAEGGSERVITYREKKDEKNKGKKNKKKKGFKPRHQQRQEDYGESEEGYQDRMDAIDRGDHEELDKWTPY